MPWNLILGGFWCAKIKTTTTHSKEPQLISQPRLYVHISLSLGKCVQMLTCGRGVSCLACSSLRPRGCRARLWLRGRRRRATMGWATILSLITVRGQLANHWWRVVMMHWTIILSPHLALSWNQSHVWSLKVVEMWRSHNRISAEHKEHWLVVGGAYYKPFPLQGTSHSLRNYSADHCTGSSHLYQRQFKWT